MSRNRGRSSGRHYRLANFTTLEYINRISQKYKLDLNLLLNCLIKAWQVKESECGDLSIICRKKTKDYAIFLITKGLKVVAQFKIPNYILQESNPMKNFIFEKRLEPKKIVNIKVENPSIRELKIGMKGIKLTGKVTEISKSNQVFSRLGEPNKVANAKLADETGFIQLALWNQQIEKVAPGDLVQVENAYVAHFRGELQLRIRGRSQLKIIKKGKSTKIKKKAGDS
jgi:hypothetical protein